MNSSGKNATPTLINIRKIFHIAAMTSLSDYVICKEEMPALSEWGTTQAMNCTSNSGKNVRICYKFILLRKVG